MNTIRHNEQEQARKALAMLDSGSAPSELPESVLEALKVALQITAAGHRVTVTPARAEYTTQEAAEVLNVSRPYVIKLLDQGAMEYRKVGRHRRIPAEVLQRYKREQQARTRAALDELAALGQEMELDDRDLKGYLRR